MDAWMAKNGASKVWVVSTNEAEPFYAACGFSRDDPPPIQMTRRPKTGVGGSRRYTQTRPWTTIL
jgi:hypothetical protein